MAATATPPAVVLFVLVLVALLLAPPPRAAAALPCPTVYSVLMPCLGYVESGGAVPLTCCAGIRQLVSGARTTPDRRAICACLKDLAPGAPAPDIDRAAGLPDRCGVKLGYKLSPDMDCSKVK